MEGAGPSFPRDGSVGMALSTGHQQTGFVICDKKVCNCMI